MHHLTCVFVAALTLLSTTTSALTVHVTPVEHLDAAPSPHEPLLQRWTVAPSAASEQIHALEIDSFCQVFISYAPQNANDSTPLLATVLVSGSDFKLITAADVVVTEPETLAVRLLDVSLDTLDGFVGVHIIFHQPHAIFRLTTKGDGEIVVTENLLVENDPQADFLVEALGDGAVYLPSHLNITANSITLATHGSASLYLPTASRIAAATVSFLQSGTGAIAATSAVLQVVHTIAVAASETGSVCIDSAFLETNVIRVHTTSAGDLYVGGHDGSYESTHRYFCDATQIFQNGSGTVDLGTVLCIDSAVELYGRGDVIVASARSLGGRAYGKGRILYAGDMPIDILDVDPWAFLKQPIAHPAEGYQRRTCTVPTPPVRKVSRIEGQASIVQHIITPARIGVVVLLTLCGGAVYVAETRRQRLAHSHNHRPSERTPLLAARTDASA